MSNRSSNRVFGISTIPDYLAFCEQTVAALAEDQADVVKGFAAILALNHVPDWLQYKLAVDQRKMLSLSSFKQGDKVIDDFENQNADLKLIRSLANGFKHLRPVDPTGKIEGYGKGPFGIGPFGEPYLLIDLGEGLDTSNRWVVALNLCEKVLLWWKELLCPVLPDLRGKDFE